MRHESSFSPWATLMAELDIAVQQVDHSESVRVRVTTHALQRFVERVRPGLSLEAARLEMNRLVTSGHVQTSPPSWYRPGQLAHAYLVLGDVTWPLLATSRDGDRLIASTSICRGHIVDRRRREQRRKRRKQVAERRERQRQRRLLARR